MCERENELVDALRSGLVNPDLRAHAASCATCGDLIEVAGALLDDRRALMREAKLPGSGLVWWRAAMRDRQETARRALRAARIIQAVLVMIAAGVGIALIGPQTIDLSAIVTAIHGFAVPIVAVVGLLILAPVTVYFVVTEE